MPATHNNAGIAAAPIRVRGDAKIQSFAEALAFLREHGEVVGQGTKNVTLRVLKINADGLPSEIGVQVYNTVVVAYRNDETFTTNSGGFITPTTCSRINQFTPNWAYCSRGDRTIWIRSYWADNHINRFRVATREVVGPVDPGPTYHRKTAKTPHGTLRWLIDEDGMVISENNRYPDEYVFPVLEFEAIGRDGDYRAAFKYHLERCKLTLRDLRGTKGIAKSEVPLALVNAHRAAWGMPEITRTA